MVKLLFSLKRQITSKQAAAAAEAASAATLIEGAVLNLEKNTNKVKIQIKNAIDVK